MKYFVLVFSALMTFSSVSHSLDLVDKAVAIVEDDIILESELRRRLDHVYFTNPQIGTEDRFEVQEQVLEQLIDERLQYRIAQRANVVVTDQEVNAAMQNFAQRLQSNNQSFTNYLAAVNVTESQVAERMRRDIAVQKVQQGSLSQRITITPREIEQFLESPAGQQWLQRFQKAPMPPEAATWAGKRQMNFLNYLCSNLAH